MHKTRTYILAVVLSTVALAPSVWATDTPAEGSEEQRTTSTTPVVQQPEKLSEDTFVEPVPSDSEEENVAQEATEEATGVSEEDQIAQTEATVQDVEESKGWWDTIKSFVSNTKSEAKDHIEAMRQQRKYGIAKDDTVSQEVVQEAEAAIEEDIRLKAEAEAERKRQEFLAKKLYDESVRCLALNGYYEARNQTADQEAAVGAVVLNRLSIGFLGATTVCEVIHTPHQFSWVRTHGTEIPKFDNKIERKAWERSLLIAKRLMVKTPAFIDPSNGATHYHANYVSPKWANSMEKVATLGDHIFYVEPKGHRRHIDNQVTRLNPSIMDGMEHDDRTELKVKYKEEIN